MNIMKKKLFDILPILCALLMVFAFGASAAEVTEIGTAEELVAIMNDDTKWAADYVLTSNIDLSGQTQTSIGTPDVPFTGTFDGGNFEISGITISGSVHVGLFGTTRGATIKNLTISGTVTSTGNICGGLIGAAIAPTTLDAVTSNVTVTGGGNYTGGLIGMAYFDADDTDFTITNCTNEGAVVGGGYNGGLVGVVGSNFNTIATLSQVNCKNNDVTLSGCVNKGSVDSKSGNVAGGILGYYMYRGTSGMSYLTVTKCANYGAISATGGGYVGGVVGVTLEGNNVRYVTLEISECYNTGAISAKSTTYMGSIASLIRVPKVTDGVATISVHDCWSAGSVTAYGMIGACGNTTCAWTAERLYNSVADYIIIKNTTTSGSVTTSNNTITLTDCFNSSSDAATATSTLVTTAEDCAWVQGADGPELAAFHQHSYVDGACACGAETSLTLDSTIDSVEEFLLLAADSGAWGGSYTLATDLNLEGYTLSTIGDADVAFTGSFDGAGYTISGMTINGSKGAGLFGYVSGATIKNVKITDATVSGTDSVAALVGIASGSLTIENCTVDATVTSTGARASILVGDVPSVSTTVVSISGCTTSGSVTGTGHAGGIIGRAYANKSLTVTDCTNSASIKGTATSQTDTGGIIGRLPVTTKDGVVTITNCSNSGAITGGYGAGGIVGEQQAYCAYTQTVSGCSNIADVTGTENVGGIYGVHNNYYASAQGYSVATVTFDNNDNKGDISGEIRVGGVIGYFYSKQYDTDLTFKNSENHGTIYGGVFVGGAIGRLEYTGVNPDSTAPTQSAKISNLANYGNVTADDAATDDTNTGRYVGGIIGFTSTTGNVVTLDQLYNEGTVTADIHYAGGITSYIRSYGNAGTGNNTAAECIATLSNSENRGAVTCVGSHTGGIAGFLTNFAPVTVKTSVNSGAVSGNGTTYAIIGCADGIDTIGHTITDCFYSSETTDLYSTAVAADTDYSALDTSIWTLPASGVKHAPELTAYHTHVYEGVAIDADTHSNLCWCGVGAASEAHTKDANGVCTVCGYSECTHSGVWTEVAAEDGTVTYSYACGGCSTVLVEGAEKPYIYVDNNGSGDDTFDGLTEATAVKTIQVAVAKMTATGGDVILTSRYRTGTVNDLPAYEKEITFTSTLTEAGELHTGFVFTAHGMTFNLNGPTKFEKIIFNGANTTTQNNSDSGYYNIPVFAANWNDLTMGERILCYGVAYIAVGSNGVSESELDLGGKTVNITLHRTTARAVTDSEGTVLTAAKAFYDRVYLGDRVRTSDAYTVKNVNINFTSEDATFNNVYLATVSSATSNAQMENYNVVANFNGVSDPYIATIRTGDGNTTTGDAYLESLELNLNGYAYVKTDFVIRNIKNLKLNISTGAERTSGTLNKVPFYVSASDAFAALSLETNTEVSYGTHSFANGVAYPTYNDIYTATENVTDECTWTEQVTTEHTADVMGVMTTVCTVCERVAETTEFHVESYNEIKWAYDETAGAYVFACPVCGEAFGTAETAAVYVSDDGDDANTGLSADSAVKTLTAAVTRLADVDGTVIITGTYTLDADEELPAWSGKLLFTADPTTHDGNGAAESGFVIAEQNVSLSMGGDAKFDAILFKGTSSSVFRVVLSANYNDIEMGYIRVQNYAKTYLLAGVYYQTTDDTEEKISTMTVDGPAMSTDAGDYFYERIYLGSIYLADGIEVSNKTVTATFRDGYINTEDTTRSQTLTVNTLYMMSTAGNNNYKTSTTNGCVSTVYVNDNTGILNVRTGDRNVNQSASEGKVDNVYFYFNDNSNVVDIGSTLGTFYVRNAVNTYIYISDMDETQAWEGEGVRTEKFSHSVFFQKYGTFADKYAAATITYGTHSFVDSITDPVQNPGEYVVTRVVNDECEGNWDSGVITTEATASAPGERTFTCSLCGKTYTEEVAFECTSHVYLKLEDGSYVCGICGIDLEAPTGSAIISAVAGTVADGAVSVDIVVTADAIAGTYFTVTAPDGFTLASVSNAMNETNGFQLVTPDTLTNPCKFMLVNFSGSDGALSEQVVVTLNYTVADTFGGTGEITIECLETVNAAEADIATVTVNAVIAHEHEYVKSDIIPDTADKSAHYVYTCACGETYEVEAVAETISADSIKYGTSVILTSDFALEFPVQLSNDITVDSCWLKVEQYADGVAEPEVTVVEAYKNTVGDTMTTYRFEAPSIAAKEMNDRIVVTFCAVIGGEKYAAASAERNLANYYTAAYNAYGTETRGQAPALMATLYAMFNYGAAAQNYFGYNTDALVNAMLPEDKQVTEFTAEAAAEEYSTDDCASDVYTITDFYAVLEQKIEYALVFNGTAYAADSLVFKGSYEDINGTSKTVEISGDNIVVESGKVTVYIDTVSAKDLRRMITGALYHTDGTQLSDSATFSFECYAAKANETADTELQNICAAILNYSDAAKALFYKEPTVTE